MILNRFKELNMKYSENYPLKFPIVSHNKKKYLLEEKSFFFLIIGTICIISCFTFTNNLILILSVIIGLFSFIIYLYSFYGYRTFNITGFIILYKDFLYIENKELKNKFILSELNDIRIDFNFFEYIPNFFQIPQLSSLIKKGGSFDGTGNFIQFEFNQNEFVFELYISNKAQMLLLAKRAEEWNVITNYNN